MATVDDTIKVSVESVIHDALTNALEGIEHEFGIRVTDVRARWTDVSTLVKTEHQVTWLQITTESGR